jgi:hypothetical protein
MLQAMRTAKGGVLVAVANPEGVAPLMAIAVAASNPDMEPPPRVLAVVRGQRAGAAGPIQARTPAPSEPPALAAALEYARNRSLTIQTEAVSSETPAADIVERAHAAEVAWVLLGYHRGGAGSNTLGGVVREVFAAARSSPLNVGVFIQGTDRPFERIFAAIDSGPDGRAALDLGARIAHSNQSKLRALLLSNQALAISATQPDSAMIDIIHEARARLGHHFHSDVLTHRSRQQLFRQSPGRLVIIGKRFADEIGLPLDETPEGDRCLIVVQGADRPATNGPIP